MKGALQDILPPDFPDEEWQAYERYQHDLHYQASMVESSYTIGLRKGEKKGKRKEGPEAMGPFIRSLG